MRKLDPPSVMSPPRSRLLPAWTLFRREFTRAAKDWLDWLIAPAILAGLYLAVLGVAGLAARPSGEAAALLAELPGGLVSFAAPGLVVLTIGHSAFMYGAFPIILLKLEGTIADQLMAPIGPLETALAHSLAAACAGLVPGMLVMGTAALFVPLGPVAVLPLLLGCLLIALFFGTLGALCGLASRRWDHFAFADGFLVMPALMLSAAFFPLAALPEGVAAGVALSPVFAAVDAVRFGLIGVHEGALWRGLALLAAATAAMLLLLRLLLGRGWRLVQ